MDFERYVNDVANFFDNYPEVKRHVNDLNLDPVYELIAKEAGRLGDNAFHAVQTRLTSCFTYVLVKAGINPIEHVTKIPAYFMYEHDVENLDISNVRSIGNSAFYHCDTLKHVKISNVEYIGQKAFNDCINLQSADLQNVSVIERYVFDSCHQLKTVNIDDSVSYIDMCVFNGCRNLKSFKWPKNATTIESSMFGHCKELQDLELPNTVSSIENDVFFGCDKLQSIKFDGTKEQWKKVFKVKYWRKESMISEVICTDGKVTYKVD